MFIGREFFGVPDSMMSPGSSVMKRDRSASMIVNRKYHFRDCAFLHHLAVDVGAQSGLANVYCH